MNPEKFEQECLANTIKSLSSEAIAKNILVGRVLVIVGLLASFSAFYFFRQDVFPGLWWLIIAFFGGVFFGLGFIYVRASSAMRYLASYVDVPAMKNRINELQDITSV